MDPTFYGKNVMTKKQITRHKTLREGNHCLNKFDRKYDYPVFSGTHKDTDLIYNTHNGRRNYGYFYNQMQISDFTTLSKESAQKYNIKSSLNRKSNKRY